MTVAQLIQKLSTLPQNSPVLRVDNTGVDFYEEVNEVFTIKAENSRTREQADVVILATMPGTEKLTKALMVCEEFLYNLQTGRPLNG